MCPSDFYFGPLSFIYLTLARAGGGGGGDCDHWLCIVLLPIILIYGLYVNIRINRKKRKVSRALVKMAQREPGWTEHMLISMAKTKFLKLQKLWSQQNLDEIKNHLKPPLFSRWKYKIEEQKRNHEVNLMRNVQISKARIVHVENYTDDEKDMFTICIDASADDKTIRNGVEVKVDSSAFREFWTFEWEKGEWLLRDVDQAKNWKKFVTASILYEPK